MKITFIQTGGTIDKDYPHTTRGWAFEFGEPATHRILDRLAPSFTFEVITAFLKDSLEITDQDRQELADLIARNQDTTFIITHGTDTLIQTAEFLHTRIKDKLIVVTGAMRPERFSNSDAPINLGMAIGVANLKQKGVYIAMHGIVKPAGEMRRDLPTGRFY